MSNIDKLIQIMKRLRDPVNGCPWDLKQDYNSIYPYTIEEVYEVVECILNKDYDTLKDELGDLLLQIVFLSQIASEDNKFNFDEVIDSISNKLIRRHPHIFDSSFTGDNSYNNQKELWEDIKEKERTSKNQNYILDDIPNTLPSLTRSSKIQRRVSKVNFDWDNTDELINKIDEEIDELKQAIKDNSNIKEEIGDLFFCLSNLCNRYDINPDSAAIEANAKFEKRFNYIEDDCNKKKISLKQLTKGELEELWIEAKKNLQ